MSQSLEANTEFIYPESIAPSLQQLPLSRPDTANDTDLHEKNERRLQQLEVEIHLQVSNLD